jgi:GNAT superfamily N-acetyltransferase
VSSVVVRRAYDPDASAVLEVLERSLGDDPFVRWLARSRRRAVRSYLSLMLERIAFPKGIVHVALRDGAPIAAALWAPPKTFELSAGESLRLLPTMLTVIGPWRFTKVAATLDDVERARPPEPRWLLTLLGTVPEERGRGVGSAVLAPILAQCDSERAVAVCETSERRNLGFYARQGFTPTAERRLSPDGPPSWTLKRTPREPLVS